MLFLLVVSGAFGCASLDTTKPTAKSKWSETQGGLVHSRDLPVAAERLDQVIGELQEGIADSGLILTGRILNAESLGAWAWPDGTLYVSRPLLELAGTDELRAALAHELGHLIDADGHRSESRDELRADRAGCALLERLGHSSADLGSVLSLVAEHEEGAVAMDLASRRAALIGRRLGSRAALTRQVSRAELAPGL